MRTPRTDPDTPLLNADTAMEASMCHRSERWNFWSRRQQKTTTEPVNQAEAAAPKPAEEPREDERTRREKELERLS